MPIRVQIAGDRGLVWDIEGETAPACDSYPVITIQTTSGLLQGLLVLSCSTAVAVAVAAAVAAAVLLLDS
jgi:hypothetical protein